MTEKKKELSTKTFEESLSRLEEILELMNSGKAGLDDSLKLFEEANQLILSCNKRLNEAEKKIEKLIKNRNGDLQLDENGRPMTEDFSG